MRKALFLAAIVLFITASIGLTSVGNNQTVKFVVPESSCTPFGVIGDYGDDSRVSRRVAEMIDDWEVEFIITTGDNNYPDGEASTIDKNVGKAYHAYIHPYKGRFGEGADINRFFPSLGNHDYHVPNAQPYLDYFTLPGNERYYDFVWGPIHFFALNSDDEEPDGVTADSKQAEWLNEQLAQSTASWKVVYFHHAPYSSSAKHGSSEFMQWPFAEWGADVTLTGHNHLYERLFADDIPHIIVGNSGNTERKFPRSLLDDGVHDWGEPLPESLVRFNENHGAVLGLGCKDALHFMFVTIDGELIDTLTLEAED